MVSVGSDYSSDESGSNELSEDDSYEVSLRYGVTSDTRLRFRKDMSVAQWDADRGTAEVVVKKGKSWTVTGFTRRSQHFAFIEEVVFMVEQGSLELREGDRVINLLEAYSLVSSPLYGCSWDNYQVYSYLRKLGYIVGRHNVLWTLSKKRPPVLPAQLENLTVQFAEVEVSDGAQHDDGICEMLSEVSLQSERVQSKTAFGSETVAELPAMSSSDGASEVRTIKELQDPKSRSSGLTLMYDVHLPDGRFKKSSPGIPAFSLCSASRHPPHRSEVRALEQSVVGRRVKFTSVICDHVTIYSFDAVELPTLP
ncbi:hypothetical protein M758_5G032300 [Ceratodon purpureus]|nr:hypothetical protein M758_5G032300 [Ceratodon purpureus]